MSHYTYISFDKLRAPPIGFTTGVLRTTLFGVIFSILYIGIGSILPLVIFHFLINYVAKLGDFKAEN
ncbi:CPBP family glutamic-type intramembrane protease [Bacillus niameyensis]|uniref:CPBP family glutamic-type intramembrane protease n=1 Tax=Bacillus niameyensis TaxID=1522308 RepID=UPI000782CF75|nr:CPBP family glutamic-type intramembrane protease [Bacillus niameyensis]